MEKKLDMRAIADPGGAVYKRTFPGKKTDAVVCVLVDNSGSMIGHRIEAAKVAALTLYDFCRKAGIPILVYGHHTDGYDHRDPSEETVYFSQLCRVRGRQKRPFADHHYGKRWQ